MARDASFAPKVLIYTNAPYRGGAEVLLSEVISALPEQIDLTISGTYPEVVDFLGSKRPGVSLLHLPDIAGRNDLGGMITTARAFRRIKPDVIHFNLGMVSACQWAMFIAVLKGRYATVAVENSPVAAWSSTSGLLKKFTSPRLSAHVAVGERTARDVERIASLKAGSLGVLHHGVRDVRRDLPVDRPAGPTLVHIGRHQHVKGVDVLLRALALLPDDVHLVQIGDGEETDALVALADELGVAQRVDFQMTMWDERAADRLAAYDLFVLPSRNEGLPVTVMEAMLAGLPIVSTEVGSIREELTEAGGDRPETGVIVPTENPAALAEAIQMLLADPARRQAMGAAARADALERFTVERTVERYLDLWDAALTKAR